MMEMPFGGSIRLGRVSGVDLPQNLKIWPLEPDFEGARVRRSSRRVFTSFAYVCTTAQTSEIREIQIKNGAEPEIKKLKKRQASWADHVCVCLHTHTHTPHTRHTHIITKGQDTLASNQPPRVIISISERYACLPGFSTCWQTFQS